MLIINFTIKLILLFSLNYTENRNSKKSINEAKY